MTPLALATLWLAVCAAGAVLARVTGRPEPLWLASAALGALVMRTGVGPGWPGPAAAATGHPAMVLGRPGAGLLAAAAIAIALTLLLAPALSGGELVLAGLVGSASVVLLSATVPLIWGLAAAVAVGALAVRWVTVAPGTATLAAGRVGGLGASCLLGAASFIAPAGGPYEPRAVLSGSMLALGVCSLLALAPLGGWAAGAVSVVRGADLSPWAFLLAPSLILSAMILAPGLVIGGRIPFNNAMLVLGLFTAVVGGLAAARTPGEARFGRLLIADLALAAAGVGTTHAPGRSGAFIIILTHLCLGPLLLNPSRAGLRPQRRLAWLALSGVPPTPGFWGRYLVLAGCTATAPAAMVAGLVAATLLLVVALEPVVGGRREPRGEWPAAGRLQRGVAWAVALAAIALGLSPAAWAARVFGL